MVDRVIATPAALAYPPLAGLYHVKRQAVHAGQPIAGIFSRELLASQTEYLAVRRAAEVAIRLIQGIE